MINTGDSYDNAMAETINGLYKAEVLNKLGPWKTIDALEFETLYELGQAAGKQPDSN